MKVLKIKITNFRGINTEREIELRHFTTLVGRNDSGKSTVLKALDLFLNESTFERDYINQKSQDPLTSIELFLDPQNTPIIIDENIPTTFEDEELLNKDGQLQIKKTWDGSKTSRITPISYIIRKRYANHDCVLLNEQDLINICNALSIATRKANN